MVLKTIKNLLIQIETKTMKSNKILSVVNVVAILLLLFTTSCYYDQVLPVEIEGDVSYATDIQPFFDAKCISCHGGNVAPDLSAPDSYGNLFSGNYINASDPGSSLLFAKINTGGSMEPYASDTERALTLKWIEQGAQDN